jgi:hypothetical protein
MPRIIGFHGYARSGKDTSGSHLIENYGFTRFACADPLKQHVYTLDCRLNGTVSLAMLLDSLDGDWAKAENHRVYGAEVRRTLETYRGKLVHDVFGAFGRTQDEIHDDMLTLDPFLDGDLTVGMFLDSLGGDWEKAKNHRIHKFEIRRLQQVYGTEVCRVSFGSDIWVQLLERNVIASGARDLVVTDIRFDEEAAWIVAQGGQVIEVVRDGIGAANGHTSEKGIDPKYIFATVENNGTIAGLTSKLDDVLKLAPVALAAA